MGDVEFISELFVGLIAGPQDKKKTLDDYYQNFDGSMPLQADWVAKFEHVRDFTRLLLVPAELRAWNGKSDFYSLFLALAPLADRTPRLTASEKEALRAHLITFRQEVDQAKRKDNKRAFAPDVHEYAEALTRASTDLGRRETRLRILETRLQNILVTPKRRVSATAK